MSDAAPAALPPAPDVAPGPDPAAEQPAGPRATSSAASSSGDKPPKARARKRERSGASKRKGAAGSSKPPSAGAVLNAELRQIEEKLTALLVLPAVPMEMSGDKWPAEHIETHASPLAHQVTETARRNPALRAQLQRFLSAGDGAQLGFAALSYLAPVLIYYGVVPVPPMLKEQLHVPDRGAARAGVMPDWEGPVSSADGPPRARPGAFTEQPPGTPGAAPAAAPGAAPLDG